MGVQGLWQLIESLGRPVTLESLENKTLAIDVSIWLNQAVRGYREGQGSHSMQNAHLLTLFNRICKLLHYRIKPVFVFDGGIPVLKKQTLASRRQRKDLAAKQSHNLSQKLLMNYIRKRVIEDKLHKKGSEKTKSSIVFQSNKSPSKKRDLYELPPIPQTSQAVDEDESGGDDDNERISLVEEHLHKNFQNLDTLNLDCENFQSLPVEIRHEILTECKDLRKKNSWAFMDNMPKESHSFSNFQMTRLLKRRSLQKHLEQVEKEMAACSSGQVSSVWNGDYSNFNYQAAVKRIMSEDSVHYVLLEGLDKNKSGNSPVKITPSDGSSIPTDNSNSVLKMAGDKEIEKAAELSENTDTDVLSDDDRLPDCNILEHYQKLVQNATSSSSASNHKNENSSLFSERLLIMDTASDNAKWESDSYSAAYDASQFIDNSKTQDVFESLSNKTADYSLSKMIPHDNCTKETNTKNSEKQMDIKDNITHFDISGSENSSDDLHFKNDKNKKSITTDSSVDVNLPYLNDDSSEITKLTESNSTYSEKELSKKTPTVKQIHHFQIDSPPSKRAKLDSVSSENSDDFIEVVINPQQIKEDDLFPLEVFNANVENNSKDLSNDLPSEKIKKNDDCTSISEIPIPSNSKRFDELPTSEIIDGNKKYTSAAENCLSSNDNSVDNEISAKLTMEELKLLNQDLTEKEKELVKEKSKCDRIAADISDLMYTDSQELLRLFGIPFVISPMEAEAQCAFLDSCNLTEGTITEDSDVWLFGGQRVYKNFFNQKKHVEYFKNTDIKNNFGLDREKLICLALLTGSDYTDGIEGIGCVTAMELFSEFPGKGLESLKAFKDWWDKAQKELRISQETKIKEKLRHVSVPAHYPNEAVFSAYLHPTVDESMEKFSWGLPDLDALRNFTEMNFGWNKRKTDDILLPLLKRVNVQETQTRLDKFFNVTLEKNPLRLPSKRVQRAVNKISTPKSVSVEETPKEKAIRIFNRKNKPASSAKKSSQNCEKISNSVNGNRISTLSHNTNRKRNKKSTTKKMTALPNTVSLSEESSMSD